MDERVEKPSWTGAGTDVFLGYHSEEGWTAAIHLLTKHYGYEAEVREGTSNRQIELFPYSPYYKPSSLFNSNSLKRKAGRPSQVLKLVAPLLLLRQGMQHDVTRVQSDHHAMGCTFKKYALGPSLKVDALDVRIHVIS